jgi:hypothetical protein
VNPTVYMIDPPGHSGQPMLNSLIFDSSPQRTSSHARGALLCVDDRMVEILRGVDYETVFGVGGLARYGLGISLIVGGYNVTHERLPECREIKQPRQEIGEADWHGMMSYILEQHDLGEVSAIRIRC